jgi:hypothetical protein
VRQHFAGDSSAQDADAPGENFRKPLFEKAGVSFLESAIHYLF